MKRVRFLVLIVTLGPVGVIFAEWEIVGPESVEPGTAFVMYVASDLPTADLRGEVSVDGSLICTAIGFALPLETEHGAKRVSALLLALPSTHASPAVTVRITGTEERWYRERTIRVGVVKRDFLLEEIRLDSAMSGLRRSDEAGIRVQAERLWEILLASNPAALHLDSSMVYPLERIYVTAFFGDRRVYRYSDGTTDRSIHHGIDFRGATGTPVFAPGRGVAVFAAERIMTGKTVIIEHLPGMYSIYYHLDSITVAESEPVIAGTVIGRIGSTGLVTGPHLHWEIRVSGVAVDPELFLSGAPLGRIIDTGRAIGHIVR